MEQGKRAIELINGHDIISETSFNKMGEKAFAQLPVGAGPFIMVSDSYSNQIVMKKNPTYWQAPKLLTHRDLRPATRDRLERAACRQAEKLYQARHFLPEIINRDLLNVAFVEAVIRRSA